MLTAIMRELNLSAAGYRRLELAAPWGIDFDQAGVRGIHIVLEGRCEAVFGRKATALEAGDLVIAPRADRHVLRSAGAPASAVKPAKQLVSTAGRVKSGGKGGKAVVLCGAFAFSEASHPALSGLPRFMHVRGERGEPARWLRGYVDALLAEAEDEGPGSAVVAAKLSAAIIARALRHTEDAGEQGWLHGLGDPAVAKALGHIHDDVEKDWTIEALAKSAGLSRAAFAKRFRERVGEAPMRYLFLRRMLAAESLLREGRMGLARIAAATGYASEAAFSAAFKRHAGVAPGQFRKAPDA
ncbi:MAG TPA: AraC family transcriptional regulator [Hyphomonadaceae bacterium]|nr:AraC family transcriptional regulator [Hyphomonadaceae bacterium]